VSNVVVGRVWSFHDVTERERLLQRAELLADASRLLTSLELPDALEAVARLSVPLLGDACTIDLLGNGAPRRIASYSSNGDAELSGDLHPAVLGGSSVTYSSLSHAYLGVPLSMKSKLLGGMTFVAPPEKRFDDFEIEMAEALAMRASLAIENGRLFESAQSALRAREEFLSVAAHEIRGPLTSIHLAAQKLAQGSAASSKHLLDLIVREDRRLGRFVEELLDLGRIQTGQLRFEMEQVNLAHVVHDVVARLAPEISASGSRISVDVDEATVGEWDRFRIEQVVNNLIANAIKFGQGKPIEVDLRQEGDDAVFSVRDHGVGIDPEMHERIFKPFERQASIRNYGGLGLGLYIVRTIVEGLGGMVSVASIPNEGAEFTVRLPRKRAS
jgi:signal transduction histidine kinase